MYKLHAFCQSGNCYKVALTLDVLGQPWEPVLIDFFAGETRSAQYRQDVNELGEAPVLDDDVLRLTQSGVILTYLAHKHLRYGGENEAQQREVLRWLFFDNHKFTSYFATWRFLKSFAGTAPEPAVGQFLKGRIDNAFGIVEKHLAGQPYIVGGAPTIADLSLCGYLFFPVEESGYDIAARYPAMAAWLARLRELPGWTPPYELLPGEQVAPRW